MELSKELNINSNFDNLKRGVFGSSLLMKMKMKRILAILVTGVIFSCSGDDNPSDDNSMTDAVDFDREAMLAHWADHIILPAYTDFLSQVNTLETAANAFVAQPDAIQLESLRTHWETTYNTWQKVSMFEIGPAESINYRLNINIYPANTDLIQMNIAQGNYNLDLSSNRVAKGFPALDYMLFGLAADDSGLLAQYTGEQAIAHKQYLLDLIADIRSLTTQVKNGWDNGYRDSFVTNSGSSATASVDRYVNDFIYYYEKHLRAGKMGIPAGVFSGDVVAENIEGLYHGELSKTNFLIGLNAIQDFFKGKHYTSEATGPSLASYLDALNVVKDEVDLSAVINAQIDQARASVQTLSPFATELQQNPPTTFLEAYDEVQRVVPLMKVDMVSALSIMIDFVDADGD